jgi:hypothetical protein
MDTYDKNKANVLADYVGSSDLYYAMHMLFEERLGMNLFRPMNEKGWLKKTVSTATHNPGEEDGISESIDDVLYLPMKMETDGGGHYTQKLITFDKFLDMGFDIIVGTKTINEEPFYNIIKSHQLDAKFIRQCNNIHEKPTHCKNALVGMLTPMPKGINYLNYHPEHYKGYCHTTPTNHNTITNFANNLHAYQNELKLWNDLKGALKDFTFKMYGVEGDNGTLPHWLMPEAMKEPAFIWHIKPHGGGGFVARQALGCGRPCIVKKSYCNYHHELADKLFKDGINCIDFDLRAFKENVKLIREWSEPDAHIERCKTVSETFKEDVDFVDEAQRIKAWIEGIPKEV